MGPKKRQVAGVVAIPEVVVAVPVVVFIIIVAVVVIVLVVPIQVAVIILVVIIILVVVVVSVLLAVVAVGRTLLSCCNIKTMRMMTSAIVLRKKQSIFDNIALEYRYE